MKKLILSLLFISTGAFASGKLMLQPNYFIHTGKVLPSGGLSIYQPIIAGINFSSYTGLGLAPRNGEPSVFWAVQKVELEKFFGRWGITAGVTFRHAEQTNIVELADDHDVHVKATLKLW